LSIGANIAAQLPRMRLTQYRYTRAKSKQAIHWLNARPRAPTCGDQGRSPPLNLLCPCWFWEKLCNTIRSHSITAVIRLYTSRSSPVIRL